MAGDVSLGPALIGTVNRVNELTRSPGRRRLQPLSSFDPHLKAFQVLNYRSRRQVFTHNQRGTVCDPLFGKHYSSYLLHVHSPPLCSFKTANADMRYVNWSMQASEVVGECFPFPTLKRKQLQKAYTNN